MIPLKPKTVHVFYEKPRVEDEQSSPISSTQPSSEGLVSCTPSPPLFSLFSLGPLTLCSAHQTSGSGLYSTLPFFLYPQSHPLPGLTSSSLSTLPLDIEPHSPGLSLPSPSETVEHDLFSSSQSLPFKEESSLPPFIAAHHPLVQMEWAQHQRQRVHRDQWMHCLRLLSVLSLFGSLALVSLQQNWPFVFTLTSCLALGWVFFCFHSYARSSHLHHLLQQYGLPWSWSLDRQALKALEATAQPHGMSIDLSDQALLATLAPRHPWAQHCLQLSQHAQRSPTEWDRFCIHTWITFSVPSPDLQP